MKGIREDSSRCPIVFFAFVKVKAQPFDARTSAGKVDFNEPPKFEKALKEARFKKAKPDGSVAAKSAAAKADKIESKEKHERAETKKNVTPDAQDRTDEEIDGEQDTSHDGESPSEAPKAVKPKSESQKPVAASEDDEADDKPAVPADPVAKAGPKPEPVQIAESDETPKPDATRVKKQSTKETADLVDEAAAQFAQAAAVTTTAQEKPVEVATTKAIEAAATPTVTQTDAKAKGIAHAADAPLSEDAPSLLGGKPVPSTAPAAVATPVDDARVADEAAELPDVASPHADHDAPPSVEVSAIASQHSFAHQLEKAVDVIHPAPAQPVSEASFVEQNHETIATSVRTTLLPGGGTMHLRLDPPELGALQVSVTMRDGVMTATFQTSNDEATRLLSHSMSDLKATLESQGVTIDRMQVQQSPRESSTNGDSSRGNREGQPQTPADAASQQQDQQRREMLKRMWRRVAGGGDPLDLVA